MMFADGFWLGSLQPFDIVSQVDLDISQLSNALALWMCLVVLLSFHEFAHAWMAFRLGDDTAAKLGRLTLNPMAHLDPVGSIALLLMGFGWAKPVPVDVRYLRNPKEDMVKVAAAGPISNLLFRIVDLSPLSSPALALIIFILSFLSLIHI